MKTTIYAFYNLFVLQQSLISFMLPIYETWLSQPGRPAWARQKDCYHTIIITIIHSFMVSYIEQVELQMLTHD